MMLSRATIFLCLWVGAAGSYAAEVQVPRLPNIVFIVLDDLDYFDVGSYGSPDVQTPNIDRLASEGMRFERYYVAAPVCSPSRAGILSGQHPVRYGIKRATLDTSQRGLPGAAPSIAELLRSRGYRTAHLGKWHLGTGKPEFLPSKKGFDRVVRLETEHGLSYLNFSLNIDDVESRSYADGRHLTRVLTDHAIDFMEDALEHHAGQPFFLNLWYLAPHKPLADIPPDYDNSKTRYCLDDGGAGRECSTARGKFAALVSDADAQTQRILDFLDSHVGLRENTLVVVSSDNGGELETHCPGVLRDRNLREFKGTVFDGAIRVPLVVRWPGVVTPGTVNRSVVSSLDFLPTLAELSGAPAKFEALAGESFFDMLRTNSLKRRSAPLFWENKDANVAFTNASGILNTYAVLDSEWKLTFTPATDLDGRDRIELFNVFEDPSESNDLAHQPPVSLGWKFLDRVVRRLGFEKAPVVDARHALLVDRLQREYFAWRADQDVEYVPELISAGVEHAATELNFSNGVAVIKRDIRLDFDDGDFGFMVRATPARLTAKATIAEKPESWHLFVEDGLLVLEVWDQPPSASSKPAARLTTRMRAGREHHIAFTVFGWRDSPSTIRLYLDGEVVAQSNSAMRVNARDVEGEPMIYIGNDNANASPYCGSISMPRLSVLSYYPSEVFVDYATALQGGGYAGSASVVPLEENRCGALLPAANR